MKRLAASSHPPCQYDDKSQGRSIVDFLVVLVAFISLWGPAAAVVVVRQSAAVVAGAEHLAANELFPDSGFCDQVIKPFKIYDCKEYRVTTHDGFLLSIQRIQRNDGVTIGNNSAGDVLFWHSALLGGSSWFVADNPTPLALADAAYSVWIAHARGTQYTFGHKMLTSSEEEFWNWGMDEWTNYDFPAITDFVHYKTDGRKFHFVGYSQGARVGIGALTYQQNTTRMLASVSMLAPVVFMINTKSPVFVAYNYTRVAELAYKIGVGKGKLSLASVPDINRSQNLTEFKRELLCQFTGPNCCIDSDKVFDIMTGQYSHTTFKNLAHLAQNMRDDHYRSYDFGNPTSNMEVYNNYAPPIYLFEKIPGSIALFVLYGGHDRLSTPTDVHNFVSQLPTAPELLFHPSYAHLDFLYSKSMELDINLPLLNFIAKHSCSDVKG